MATPAPAAPKIKKLGDYEVLVGTSPVAFWPLDTKGTLSSALPPIVAAPTTGAAHSTVVTPIVGIFDIIVRTHEGIIEEQAPAVTLTHTPAGKATIKKAPLEMTGDNESHIRFAVDHAKIATGGSWEGSIRITGKGQNGATAAVTVIGKGEVKLKVARSGTATGMVVFFVANAKPKKYGWTTLKVLSKGAGTPALEGVHMDVKVLREQGHFKAINRRIDLTTDAGGNVIGAPARKLLAIPAEWPVIYSMFAPSHVTLGHMVKLKAADIHDNLAPVALETARMLPTSAAKLTGKKFILDAGHGVVYGLAKARRSQEWYVAHRLGDRIAEILVGEYGVKPADILWTRTAGFGLIEPTQVRIKAAPENGDAKFKVDLPKKLIAAKTAAIGLHQIADLLLTEHSDPTDAAVAPATSAYDGLLTRNATAVKAIVARLDTALAATKERVKPGSPHWNATTKRYVYTKEKKDAAGTWVAAATTTPFPINTTDWFVLDAPALRVLAERSARWSIQQELGGDLTFQAKVRAAMQAEGALDYFRDKVLHYLNVPAGPHPYLASGPKAWGPSDRLKYFTNHGTTAAMVVTLHENAGGGKGGMVLVSHKPTDPPPPDQVRIAKTMVKYLDAFDQGLRQSGVVKDLPGNPAAMLYSANGARARYIYFETEFMDGPHPDGTAGGLAYEVMVTSDWIDRVANQMVWGMIEWMLNKQANFDSVTFDGTLGGGLW